MQVKVYLITNQITGKKYVGQTSRTIARRFWEHANNNKSAIGLAIQKYGRENFNIKVLEICASREQANERERYWIAFHNCIAPYGYNLTDGGDSCSFSVQAHLNMSAGQKRRYSNPAEHEKIFQSSKASCTDARRSSRFVVCFREGKNIGRGQTPRKRKSTAAKVRQKIRSGKATGSYSRRTR